MNKLLEKMIENNNYKLTENGAIALKSTNSALYDLFTFGGSMRNRSDEDVILKFRNAFEENPIYALKCLFYLRDILEGQGERRFFRVCIKDLAKQNPQILKRNLKAIPIFGRWDDLYSLVDTPLELDALKLIVDQLNIDLVSKTPSLCAKWAKSENTSSIQSRKLGKKTREAWGITAKQYRKILSTLRKRINVLERLMSANEWEKIEFDKIPSVAGLRYRNAFAKHDIERAKANVRTYTDFAQDDTTKVNAKALQPYQCVEEAINLCHKSRGSNWWQYKMVLPPIDSTERKMINKYWDNLTDYFNGASLDALAIVDTSGSMHGTPINVAISLGLYTAEKARGPFNGYYISFSSRPQLIKTEGIDFCDKVARIYETNLCENTNLQATFKMILDTAIKNHCSQNELPKNIIVISDMEIDYCSEFTFYNGNNYITAMETMRQEWAQYGYKMPKLIFWNVDARNDTILDKGENISFVSGFSPSIFQSILSGKTGIDLMYEVLNKERYSCIK